MSNSSKDRDFLPDKDGEAGQKKQSKDDKRKRKLATGGSRAQNRHRRRHHHHHHHHQEQQEHEAQNGAEGELLEHFRRLVQEQDGVALNALLAAGNNIEMAAQLWMDDLIASQAVANPRPEKEDRKMAARRNESSDDDDDDDDDSNQSSNPPSPKNLESDFGRAADEDQQQRRRAGNNNEDHGDAEDGEDEDQNGIEQRQLQRQIIRDAIQAASVSDDEGNAGIWKQIRNRLPRNNANDLGQRVREAAAAVADKVLADSDPPHETRRTNAKNEDGTEDIDYISDSDWLMESASSTADPFGPLLWGASGASINENEFENVVADEDADEKSGLGIPHTWLHASFSLSKCGNGLAIQAPKVEDIEFFTWRQQQNQDTNNGIPPPHHCRAITAIMSIVTAILYAGASIQGNDVNCTSARKPFADLSPDEKRREYESRLADALAALIFVAAKASLKRKKRSMSNLKTGSDNVKAMMMKRRLHLIPTCQWEDEPSLPRQPDSPSYRYIQVAMSLTNIVDIRLFVLSNIRSFTSPGGVALLLETILRIHGKGVIARMIERARKVSGRKETGGKCLVNCSCEERAKKLYGETPLPASVRNNPSKLLDTTPPGHECIGVELVSLLLTGTVHSTWENWSTEFEFGVLTKKTGEVGFELARPEKPVWLLQGDTCYSLLWLGGGKEHEPQNVARRDLPGAVLDFVHWNCWYELRNKTEFRLISASNVWKPPKRTAMTSDSFAGWRSPLESRSTTELLVERRRNKRINRLPAEEHKSSLATGKNVTAAQLEKVTPHPEDEKFYPKDYKMWRFDMGVGVDENNDDSCVVGDTKLHVERWVPYHRLPAVHKLVVDMKQGPKITAILWTRWPGARIENFVPEDGTFPTV